MRPTIIACALVAGAAARLILSRVRQSRQRRHSLPSPPMQIETIVSLPDPMCMKQPNHPHVLALLDTVAPVMRGASYVHNHRAHDRDCTFCLEPITSTSPYVRVTPCRHVFHAECLEQWVMYTATAALDWRNYVVADDGTVDVTVAPPTCPNCTARLPVLPARLVRHALLTAIAKSLSLPDLATAARMYDAGLVFRAPPLSIHHPQVRPVTSSLLHPTHATESSTSTPSIHASVPSLHLSSTSSSRSDYRASMILPSPTVPQANVRMLERNAWHTPVSPVDVSENQISMPNSFVLEAST